MLFQIKHPSCWSWTFTQGSRLEIRQSTMSTRGCRAEAVILETLVSWSLSQVGIEKFRTCFVVFPDAAKSDWNKVEIDRTLGIWIFSPKKTWKLLWWTVLIEDQQTCNCWCKCRSALQKKSRSGVTLPERNSLLAHTIVPFLTFLCNLSVPFISCDVEKFHNFYTSLPCLIPGEAPQGFGHG